MIDFTAIPHVPQGWQCPVCKRVYSPTTSMCCYCGPNTQTAITSGTTIRCTCGTSVKCSMHE